jgi:hypothetical protein
VIETVAGASTAAVNGLTGISSVVAGAIIGITGGQGGAGASFGLPGTGAGGGPDPCEISGTVDSSGNLPSPVTFTMSMCEVSRTGGSMVIDGTVVVSLTTITVDLTLTFKEMGATVLTTEADLTIGVMLRLAAGGGAECAFDVGPAEFLLTGVGLTSLTGTMSSTLPDNSGVTTTFNGTSGEYTIDLYGVSCVPSDWVLELSGPATVEQTPAAMTSGPPTPVVFDLLLDKFTLTASTLGDTTNVIVSGAVTSTCFGGKVSLTTVQAVSLVLGQFCPTGGQLTIDGLGGITYDNGMVTVDDLDEQTPPMMFDTCLDEGLLMCVG